MVQVPERWMRYVLPKGFIAVDGISLTVGEVGPDWFAVYLIPETLRVTTLGSRAVGDAVNVEIDSQTQVRLSTVVKQASAAAGSQPACNGVELEWGMGAGTVPLYRLCCTPQSHQKNLCSLQAIVDTVENVVARYMAEKVPVGAPQ